MSISMCQLTSLIILMISHFVKINRTEHRYQNTVQFGHNYAREDKKKIYEIFFVLTKHGWYQYLYEYIGL